MTGDGIVMAVILWLCSGAFFIIGLYARWSREPMHFWSGTKVCKNEICNLSAYNRANARMWCAYGMLWVLAGVAALFSEMAAGFLCIGLAVGGLFALIYCYGRIYQKYKI